MSGCGLTLTTVDETEGWRRLTLTLGIGNHDQDVDGGPIGHVRGSAILSAAALNVGGAGVPRPSQIYISHLRKFLVSSYFAT